MDEPRLPLLRESDSATDSGLVSRTLKKLDRRCLLLCTGIVFLAYVDRSNIGFAAKDLCNELNLTHEAYGLGVSMFYAGYLTTQVLSNLMLRRFGAPAWLSFLMFAWGCVAASMGFLQNKTQFYVLRVLLGAAEGGTFPGVFYFLSLFYPPQHATGPFSVVVAVLTFSMPIASPMSAGLLSLGKYLDIDGWRLLFIVEGLLPVFYSLFFYAFLPRSPETSAFLSSEEKEWIATEQQKESVVSGLPFVQEVRAVFSHVRWWLAVTVGFFTSGLSSMIMFWITLIIHDMLTDDDEDEDSKTCGSKGGSSAVAVLLTAIPYIISGFGCLLVKRFEIRNRPRFIFIFKFLEGLALVAWVGAKRVSFGLGFVFLCISIASGYVATGSLIALALNLFHGTTRATSSALFNTLAMSGSIIFPPIFGKLVDDYGYSVAIPITASIMMTAASVALFIRDPLTVEARAGDHAAAERQEANPA